MLKRPFRERETLGLLRKTSVVMINTSSEQNPNSVYRRKLCRSSAPENDDNLYVKPG